MELREPHGHLLSEAGRTRKLAIYFLSALIVVAVVVWIGVLSWGLLTVSQWLLAKFHSLWSWF
jgi:hypothetical protein